MAEEEFTNQIAIALNNPYVRYITIADEVKEEAKQAIIPMHELNLQSRVIGRQAKCRE